MHLVLFFTVCIILSANPIGLLTIFSNHKLRSPSTNSCALSDTKVFGEPFLENMTLRICFIEVFFLSGTRITSNLPEKSLINMSPTPVMYAWSMCTLFHGSTSLGNECKIVCVKYLYSLHFLLLFIYSSTSSEYHGYHACNVIFFFCEAATPQCISSCTLFITNFLVFRGNYHYK